jgi:hypothetical protein
MLQTHACYSAAAAAATSALTVLLLNLCVDIERQAALLVGRDAVGSDVAAHGGTNGLSRAGGGRR